MHDNVYVVYNYVFKKLVLKHLPYYCPPWQYIVVGYNLQFFNKKQSKQNEKIEVRVFYVNK